ncbi:hypothetical protein DPMN_031131 [Dreissena polymorpha]|uniref:Uncharacterized protein n=1 Tax=Dreissena polymorpha TaxID=45954 RepID=A0A9D4LZE3_DREPO|nr:hypothetical protein DPMN_031131 [Dreissena polymorpha]
MLLTKLISAAGRLVGGCSVWTSTQTGARTRDRSLLVQILTSELRAVAYRTVENLGILHSPRKRWFPGSSPGQRNRPLQEASRVQIQKPWDSKPGSDAYVASAQTGDGTLNPVANKASAQTIVVLT